MAKTIAQAFTPQGGTNSHDGTWGTDIVQLRNAGTGGVQMVNTINRHPNAAGTTTITMDIFNTVTTQGDTRQNTGMAWNTDAASDNSMASTATEKRIIPAGVWNVTHRVQVATAPLLGSLSCVFSYRIFRVAASPSFTRTTLFTWNSAAVSAVPIINAFQQISTNSASQPQITVEAGETLMLGIMSTVTQGAGALGSTVQGDVNFEFENTDPFVLTVPAPGIRTLYLRSSDNVGNGTASRTMAGTLSRSATGSGVPTSTKTTVASKFFNLTGSGVIDYLKTVQASRTFSLIGTGTSTENRQVNASKTFNLIGQGTAARNNLLVVLLERSATGTGSVTYNRVPVINKTFSLIGQGTVTRGPTNITLPRMLTGIGTPTYSRTVNASKTFNLIGTGAATRNLAITLSRSASGYGLVTYNKLLSASKTFSLVGLGNPTYTKTVQAQRTFSLIGKGVVTRQLSIARMFNLIGKGEVNYTKQVIASKAFSLTGIGTTGRNGLINVMLQRTALGKGIITETHPVQAYRTFTLIGKGLIPTTGPNGSSITIPIDEVPEESGGGGTTYIKRSTYIFDD